MKTISFLFLFPGRNDFSLPYMSSIHRLFYLLSILLFIIMITFAIRNIYLRVILINKFVFDERSRRVRSRAKRNCAIEIAVLHVLPRYRLPKQQIEHFCDAFSSLSRNTRSAHHQSTSYQMTRTLAITAFFALAITGASATALYSTTDSNGSVVYIEETCSKVSVSSTVGALCNEAP